MITRIQDIHAAKSFDVLHLLSCADLVSALRCFFIVRRERVFKTMLLRRPCGVFVPLWIVFLCLGIDRIFFIDAFQAPRVVLKKSSSPAPLQQSASLEEGEDLLYYGAKAQQRKNEQEPSPPPHPVVQRVYETWLWTYEKPDGTSKKTFKINYRVEGADNHGPPILLVHGFGANVNHFRNNFPALVEAGYTVYALDLLGFGASDKPLDAATTGFSIELFVQQINDFITAMQEQDVGRHDKEQPWSIAGNSIGGLSCLGVAAGWEERKRTATRNPTLTFAVWYSSTRVEA